MLVSKLKKSNTIKQFFIWTPVRSPGGRQWDDSQKEMKDDHSHIQRHFFPIGVSVYNRRSYQTAEQPSMRIVSDPTPHKVGRLQHVRAPAVTVKYPGQIISWAFINTGWDNHCLCGIRAIKNWGRETSWMNQLHGTIQASQRNCKIFYTVAHNGG